VPPVQRWARMVQRNYDMHPNANMVLGALLVAALMYIIYVH